MKYANTGKKSSMPRSSGVKGLHIATPQKPCVYGRGGMSSKKDGKY